MPSLTRILLPVDFSGRSRGAARYAAALARLFGAEITVLHVVLPPHYEFSVLESGSALLNQLYAARIEQLRKDLDEQLAEELSGVKTIRVLETGDPARKIVEYAHKGADLIIMPTHGYGPFRRFILGSVTAKVLHDADCPVMTGVHLEEAPERPETKFSKVLAAVDLGPQSKKTLEWAAWLATAAGAALTLIHVTPSLESRAGDYVDPDWRARLAAEAHREISEILEATGAAPEIVIENGDAPAVICAYAGQLPADVLVIGRGSAAGMFGRLRTNAYAIIRQSPCPVISV